MNIANKLGTCSKCLAIGSALILMGILAGRATAQSVVKVSGGDGLANVGVTDPRELVGHAVQLRRRGVTTTTFGVGADFDEQLLNSLAEGGGGNFYFIEEARQIPAFFKGELGELLTVVAERVTVTLTLPPGVRGELLNDYPVERAGKTFTVELGNLSAGDEKSVLFELTGRAGIGGAELPLIMAVRYRRAGDGGEVVAEAPPAALRYAPTAAAEAEQPDLGVIESAGRCFFRNGR